MAVRIQGKNTRIPDSGWTELKEYYDIGLELRKPFEQQWLLNLSFLAGKQYSFFNTTAQILQQVTARKGRIRVVDNKILPRYRKQVSRLIRNRPIMSCVPSTNDEDDIESARLGTKVIKGFWKNDKLQGKLRVLGGWIYSCGNGFLDDNWDPRKGPTIIDDKTMKFVYQGDVTCNVWSPFEIVVPAYGLSDGNIHSLPWLIKARHWPLEYFTNIWGEKGKEVSSEGLTNLNLGNSIITGRVTQGNSKVQGATEIRLYLQPCAKYPKGLFRVAANGVVLNSQDYPFDYYHLEQFKDIEIPGVFWGMATTEPAIWLQKIHNSTLSDIVEFNRTMGRGKWMVPRGALLQQNPDDSFGQILTYTSQMGMKPEHVTIKGLPTSYQQVLAYVAQGFMELYFQHEVTQGTNKSDIRSAEMVQVLLEQDDYGNIPTHAVFEEALESVMTRVMRRIQKGYTVERMIQVSGSGEEYEVISFKGSDLRNNTDVTVKKESSLPDSRVARRGQVMEGFTQGLYGNPHDPNTQRKVQKMLDDAVVEDIYGNTYRDDQIAKKENKLMMANPRMKIPINQYDNHETHILSHDQARKAPDHQKLKLSQNQKEQEMFYLREMAFIYHTMQHVKMIEAQKRKQLQEMMMAQGGGK